MYKNCACYVYYFVNPNTMTVEQCINAAKTIKPKVLIPYHFSNTDLSNLPARLPGIKVLLRQMQ